MKCVCKSCESHRKPIREYDGLLALGSEIFEQAKLMGDNVKYNETRHYYLFRSSQYWKDFGFITGLEAWKVLSDICIDAGILFQQIKGKKEDVGHWELYSKRHYDFIKMISSELAQRLINKTKITGVKLNVKKAK